MILAPWASSFRSGFVFANDYHLHPYNSTAPRSCQYLFSAGTEDFLIWVSLWKWGSLVCQKVVCRGDHWSPADFAPAKCVAVRRKYGYFPSGNPKNGVFRRAIHDRPYNLNRRESFLTVRTPPHLRAGDPPQAV